MLYWPLSQIMNDPLLHHAYARELRVAYHKRPDIGPAASTAMTHACSRNTPWEVPLCIVDTPDAGPRRFYFRAPTPGVFEMLERGGFHATPCGLRFMVDALH